MRSAVLLATVAATTAASTLKFSADSNQATIQFEGAGRLISVGDAGTCTKLDGSAKCINDVIQDLDVRVGNIETIIQNNQLKISDNEAAVIQNAQNINTESLFARDHIGRIWDEHEKQWVKNADIDANTARTTITTAQADAIQANTDKTTITTAQADDIQANNDKAGITAEQVNKINGNMDAIGINTGNIATQAARQMTPGAKGDQGEAGVDGDHGTDGAKGSKGEAAQTASPTAAPSAAPTAAPTHDKCAYLAGGGWTRVRHTATGGNWGPFTDQLSGDVVTGDPNNDGASWTVNFNNAVPGYNRFLFATGDCTKWLEATRDSAIGGHYSNAQRPILRSSMHNYAYSAAWYRRAGAPEDPWISIIDHGPAISQSLMLYGENNHGAASTHASAVLNNQGADVYIKN